MAVNILIKTENKVSNKFELSSLFGKKKKAKGALTLPELKKIAGNEFIYGHQNKVGCIFEKHEDGDITNTDVVLYNPRKIGRGLIVCALESDNIEVVLNVPCTTQDVRDYFYVTKKICNYFSANEFTLDKEKLVTLGEIEGLKDSIISWNIEVLETYLAKNIEQTLIICGGANPISMESEVRDRLLTLNGNDKEKVFADYLNEKQQIDAYFMNPKFYKDDDGIFAVYALTEGVDSVIPTKPHIPFNSGLADNVEIKDISKWIVSLVIKSGNEYEVAGYINYDDLIPNIPEKSLTKYDQSHLLVKGLNCNDINKFLIKHQVDL